jgi:hypothetical protein
VPVRDVARAAVHKDRSRRSATARRLVVAWQHPDERQIDAVGFLDFDGSQYRFGYIRHAREVKDFRPLIGFRDFDRAYVSDELFPLFAQRVMDARRPDYQRYVGRLGLPADATPWEQIARSQGRREGDSLQLLPEPVNHGGTITGFFLVNGVRWVPSRPLLLDDQAVEVTAEQVGAALAGLRTGDQLGLAREPGNAYNRLALIVTAHAAVPVGWVPNLMLEDMHRLLATTSVTVTVEHVNPADAPWHLRLLARFTARGAGDFRFFSGDDWQLLAAQ